VSGLHRNISLGPTRWLIAVAAVALLRGTPSHVIEAQSRPFTPQVEEFVDIYLKNGGDKLTSWVQGQTAPPADQTLRSFKAIDGLTMELVAAEPVIRQPVDLHFDDRGRLWVVQYLQYPFPAGLTINSYDQYLRARYDRLPAPPPNHVRGADKITLLEDKDGDGSFESHRDVVTGLNITTSVLTGRGGLWVMNPPYLLFYRDKTGDGIPDGGPEVRLSGFGLEDTHSLANSLTWGPDGWLYGVHGSTSTARVRGVSFLGQAVWRYHPETDAFELFAQGGGNPWTLSFDSQGRAFSGDNGGNSRGFHWVAGGRYEKNWPKHGPFNRPYSYGAIPHMSHEGYAARFAMTSVIYEDGKLPGYERQLISGMALTSRIQASRIVSDGSTFRTVDTEALVTTADRSFRPVDMTVGPDGAIYVADWCDIRMDHTDPRDTWDKSCGRIWRLRAKDWRPAPRVDLASQTSGQLVKLLGDSRKWYRDHARRLIGERHDRAALSELRRLVGDGRGQLALEALWTEYQIAGMDADRTVQLLTHGDVPVRLWAIRLLQPGSGTPALGETLVTLARTEPDPEVRSELANTASRLEPALGRAVLQELIRRQDDVADKHVPLRIWWTLEDQITRDADSVLNWLEEARLWQAPLFNAHLAGRIAQRLAADRGTPAFTRIDPDTNWKAYAEHPRVLMPGGKGDYTDWQTNDTPEIGDRNLTRVARLLEMAPPGQRDRLLAGVRAGLGQGPAPERIPGRLAAFIGAWRPGAGSTAAAKPERGREGFETYCAPCHQTDGSGMERLAAPLRRSPLVLGAEDALIRIALHGLKGELIMPAMGTLDDPQLAAILTYVRTAWGHTASPITAEAVGRVRAASEGRRAPWTREELARAFGVGR
jgi:putative membrane-bound dehydrogenase-like protein